MATASGQKVSTEVGAVTDASEELSFDEVFEIALEQAYTLMNEMSGKEGAGTSTANKSPGHTSPVSQTNPLPCRPLPGGKLGDREGRMGMAPSSESTNDTEGTCTSGTASSSSYQEAMDTVADSSPALPDPETTRALDKNRACDSSLVGETNKCSADENDRGLAGVGAQGERKVKTEESQMDARNKRDGPAHSGASGRDDRSTSAGGRDQIHRQLSDMPARRVDYTHNDAEEDSSDRPPLGLIRNTSAHPIHQSVSSNSLSIYGAGSMPYTHRTMSDINIGNWETSVPKQQLIENWCLGQSFFKSKSDSELKRADDRHGTSEINEELIKQSLNDPKALLNIIEKLTAAGDNEETVEEAAFINAADSRQSGTRRVDSSDRLSKSKKNHTPLRIETGDRAAHEGKESKYDKKRRRRFITREQAIDLPSYDAPEEEGLPQSHPSTVRHRDKAKPLPVSASTSLDIDGLGPLSPVRRQLSLQSPPLYSQQPLVAHTQPLSSPSKPDRGSQGSQDSSLDMYAIEKSATLPANFSMDALRGVPTSHELSKFTPANSSSYTVVEEPSSLPPSGTGYDRRATYGTARSFETNKVTERSNNATSSPGNASKFAPPSRGGHIDSNKPPGIHPNRRDSSGSDASSKKGSVASLPGDVPFRGSQNPVARRDKVDRNTQQRPRSLYDSSSEANKEFSSVTEPGPLFIASSYDNLGSDDSRDKSPAAPRLTRSKTHHAGDDVPKFPVSQAMRQQKLGRSKTVGDSGGYSGGYVEHRPARLHRDATRAPRDHPRPSRGESVGASYNRGRAFKEENGPPRAVLIRSHSQTRHGYRENPDVGSQILAYRERANFKPIIPEGNESAVATQPMSHVEAFRAVQRPAEAVGVFQPDPRMVATLKAPEGNRTLNTSPTSAFSRARAPDDGGLHLSPHPHQHLDPRYMDILSPGSSESLSPRGDKFSPRRHDPRGLSPREGSVESARSSGSTRSSQSSSKGPNLTEFTSRRAKSYRPSDRAKTLEISSIDRTGVEAFIATHKPVQKDRKPVQKYAEKQNRKPKEKWQAEPIPPWRVPSEERQGDKQDVPIGLQPRQMNGKEERDVIPSDFNPVVEPMDVRPDPPFKTDKKLYEVPPDVPIGLQPISKQLDTPTSVPSNFKPVVVPIETNKATSVQSKASTETSGSEKKVEQDPPPKQTVRNDAKMSLSDSKEKEREKPKKPSAVQKALEESLKEERRGKRADPRKSHVIDTGRTPTLARKWSSKMEPQQQSKSNEKSNSTSKASTPQKIKSAPEEAGKHTEAVELARLVPEPVKRKPKDKKYIVNDKPKVIEPVSKNDNGNDQSSQQSVISKAEDRKKPSEQISLVKARMSNFKELEKPRNVSSPRMPRRTQVSTSVLKLNKQLSDSVLDAPPPRDVKTLLKEHETFPTMQEIASPKIARAKQTTVGPKMEVAHEIIEPPKVEPPRAPPPEDNSVGPDLSQMSTLSKKHLGVLQNASQSVREHSPTHKERSPSVRDAKDMFSRESSVDGDKPKRNFRIPQKRIDKIPEHRIITSASLTDKLAMFRDEKRKELAVKSSSISGRSASLDITDRRDSTGLGRFARKRPTSGESIEESPAESLPDERHKPSIDEVLSPITDAISALVQPLPREVTRCDPSPLLSPPLLSPPVMTSAPSVMTSPAPAVTSPLTIVRSPGMSRKTISSDRQRRGQTERSPAAMLSPVFKYPPQTTSSSPPGSPLSRIKARIQKSLSPNAVKSPGGIIHANTAMVGPLMSPPPRATKSNTLGVISMSKVKSNKELSRHDPSYKSQTLPANYSSPDQIKPATASTAKLTLSSVKDTKKPKHTASVIKLSSRNYRKGSFSDSQSGTMSPLMFQQSEDSKSLDTLVAQNSSPQLPDVVRSMDAEAYENPENISVAMQALDSAIALLSSVSLETSTTVPLESIATMPISMLSALATSAAICDTKGTPFSKPLTVEVSTPTVLEAPRDILQARDANTSNVRPDHTRNGTIANTSVVLATSTVMTPMLTKAAKLASRELLPIPAGNKTGLPNTVTSLKLESQPPVSLTQPVATVPPLARHRDVTQTTDCGMYRSITSSKEHRSAAAGYRRATPLSDDSESILSSEIESNERSSTTSLSSEPPQQESMEQRRQRLMRSDSFNRPDSPEVEPLPLPKDSVIVRSRLRRMDSSSSTDSCGSPPRSPRVSPRMPRKPKNLRQLLESTNIRGFEADGPSSRARLGVPKAAMWRRRRSKARIFAVPQSQTMMRKRRSRSRSHSRSRNAPSHHGSLQDFANAFQKQVELHRPPGAGRMGRPRSRETLPPTQVVTPLEEPMQMPWTVPWGRRKIKSERTHREPASRARKVRDKVTATAAVRGRRGRSRSKSASNIRRRRILTEVPINHPHYGTVKSKLTTAMLSRSLRRKKDDPYMT